MKANYWIKGFVITFAVALIANIIVSSCWNYFIEGTGFNFQWGSSIVVATVLGIILPFTQRSRRNYNQ